MRKIIKFENVPVIKAGEPTESGDVFTQECIDAMNDEMQRKADQAAYEAIAGHDFYQCRCGCGFPAACGKFGCPNCDGDQGPAKLKQDMGIIRTRNLA